LLTRIGGHLRQGKAFAEDVKAKVGDDDTLYQSLDSLMDTYGKTVADSTKYHFSEREGLCPEYGHLIFRKTEDRPFCGNNFQDYGFSDLEKLSYGWEKI
jgi:hypothetical protein